MAANNPQDALIRSVVDAFMRRVSQTLGPDAVAKLKGGAKPQPKPTPTPIPAAAPESPPATVPPELLAAMMQAKIEGDHVAVDRLAELGQDAEALEEFLGDREAGTAGMMSARAFAAMSQRTFGAMSGALARPVAAGLVVRAADTGRVLMLKRADDDTDAAGLWEFPGGHIRRGELPEAGARREWIEETGSAFPKDGRFVGSWHSPNGVYSGYVWEVDSEDAVDLTPDGDQGESLRWWTPVDLTNNPQVRKELRRDVPRILPLLRGLQTFSAAPRFFSWFSDPTPRSKSRVTNSESGAHLYGERARAALAWQQREDRGEAHPETPKAALQRMKAEREPAREEARKAYRAALADPASMRPEQLPALAAHLHTLTRDEVRSNLRELEVKARGKLKGDLVDALLGHVRGGAIEALEGKLDPLSMDLEQDDIAKRIADFRGESLPGRKSSRDQDAEAAHLAENDHNKRRAERHELMKAGTSGELNAPEKVSNGTPDTGSILKVPDKVADEQLTQKLESDQQENKPSDDAVSQPKSKPKYMPMMSRLAAPGGGEDSHEGSAANLPESGKTSHGTPDTGSILKVPNKVADEQLTQKLNGPDEPPMQPEAAAQTQQPTYTTDKPESVAAPGPKQPDGGPASADGNPKLSSPTDGKGVPLGMSFEGESKKGSAFFRDKRTGKIMLRNSAGAIVPFTTIDKWETGTGDQSKSKALHIAAEPNEPSTNERAKPVHPFPAVKAAIDSSNAAAQSMIDKMTPQERATLAAAHPYQYDSVHRLIDIANKKDVAAAEVAKGVPDHAAEALRSHGIDPYSPSLQAKLDDRDKTRVHKPYESVLKRLSGSNPDALRMHADHEKDPAISAAYRNRAKAAIESGEAATAPHSYEVSGGPGRDMRTKTTTWGEHQAWRETPGRIHVTEEPAGSYDPDSERRTIRVGKVGDHRTDGVVVSVRHVNGKNEYLLRPFTKKELLDKKIEQHNAKLRDLQSRASPYDDYNTSGYQDEEGRERANEALKQHAAELEAIKAGKATPVTPDNPEGGAATPYKDATTAHAAADEYAKEAKRIANAPGGNPDAAIAYGEAANALRQVAKTHEAIDAEKAKQAEPAKRVAEANAKVDTAQGVVDAARAKEDAAKARLAELQADGDPAERIARAKAELAAMKQGKSSGPSDVPKDHAAALSKSRTHHNRRTDTKGTPIGRHVVYRDKAGKVNAVPAESFMGKELLAGRQNQYTVEGQYDFGPDGKPVKVSDGAASGRPLPQASSVSAPSSTFSDADFENGNMHEKKVGNARLQYGVNENTGRAELYSLRVPAKDRGKGSAKAAMKEFLTEADRRGLPVELLASPLDKRTNLGKLVRFYESLGFKVVGRGNPAGDPKMIREPNPNRGSAGVAKPDGFDPAQAVKIAADDVQKLRKPDVFRVLDWAPAEHRDVVAKHVKESRPDLASEVDDVMNELGVTSIQRKSVASGSATDWDTLKDELGLAAQDAPPG